MPYDGETKDLQLSEIWVTDEHRLNRMKLRNFIADLDPGQLTMSCWVNRPENYDPDDHVCNTIACIGGWMELHFNVATNHDYSNAAEWLGLSLPEVSALFEPDGWQQPGLYQKADIVRCLDNLVETGKVEWRIY
jgi:hypothetical protein